ncbi:MAG: AraC family transcriptional regulator [Spirochaetia bacterium]|nr:AraC family transcriptional regulator [Spirochaetia bacterium]
MKVRRFRKMQLLRTSSAKDHLGVQRKSSPHLPLSCRPYRDFNFDRWAPGTVLERHQHGHLQFIHVLEGRLSVDWGEGWMSVDKGMLHLLPKGFPHRLQSPGGHAQFGLNFTLAPDEGGITTAFESKLTRPLVLGIKLPESLKTLSPEVSQDPVEILRLKHVLDEYVLRVLETLAPKTPVSTSKALFHLVEKYAAAALPVEKAAAELGMSRASLQRICQEKFGCGLGQLHDQVRLGKASQMLLNTSLSISEIADTFGYNDLFSFSRAFKRIHKISPVFYRKKGTPKTEQWRDMVG